MFLNLDGFGKCSSVSRIPAFGSSALCSCVMMMVVVAVVADIQVTVEAIVLSVGAIVVSVAPGT